MGNVLRQYGQGRIGSEEANPLSRQRAFVVQFRAGEGHFAGRVEHMPSAQAARFDSADALLDFLTRMLDEVRD